MKLIQFSHKTAYIFTLIFDTDEKKEVDLKALISKYVSLKELKTAHLNAEWGCLEFKQGMVDIEPKTLYHYAFSDKQVLADV